MEKKGIVIAQLKVVKITKGQLEVLIDVKDERFRKIINESIEKGNYKIGYKTLKKNKK